MKHGIQGPGCETDFFCLFSLPNDKKNKLKVLQVKKKSASGSSSISSVLGT